MRRPVADPHAMLGAIAKRVDGTERDLAALRDDVTGLGRGVADIVAQLRRLTAGGPTRPDHAPAGPADADSPVESPETSDEDDDPTPRPAEDDEEEGQRDWFAVTEPDVAHAWLVEAAEWAAHVPAWYGLDLQGVPCWPLHPAVVGDLLALAAQREHAHGRPDPTPVTEWVTRWLPAGIARIRTDVSACRRDAAHHTAGRLVDAADLTTPEGLADVAAWWATARHVPAAEWLELLQRR